MLVAMEGLESQLAGSNYSFLDPKVKGSKQGTAMLAGRKMKLKHLPVVQQQVLSFLFSLLDKDTYQDIGAYTSSNLGNLFSKSKLSLWLGELVQYTIWAWYIINPSFKRLLIQITLLESSGTQRIDVAGIGFSIIIRYRKGRCLSAQIV